MWELAHAPNRPPSSDESVTCGVFCGWRTARADGFCTGVRGREVSVEPSDATLLSPATSTRRRRCPAAGVLLPLAAASAAHGPLKSAERTVWARSWGEPRVWRRGSTIGVVPKIPPSIEELLCWPQRDDKSMALTRKRLYSVRHYKHSSF